MVERVSSSSTLPKSMCFCKLGAADRLPSLPLKPVRQACKHGCRRQYMTLYMRFLKSGAWVQVLEGGESVPAMWATAHLDAPPRAFELQAKKVKLPMQDNYCDCGLFLLTYVDFFTHGLPASLRLTIHQRRPLDAGELASASPLSCPLHPRCWCSLMSGFYWTLRCQVEDT